MMITRHKIFGPCTERCHPFLTNFSIISMLTNMFIFIIQNILYAGDAE